MLSGGMAEGPVRAKENAIILRLARAGCRYTRLLHPGAELRGSYPRMFHARLPSLASPLEYLKAQTFAMGGWPTLTRMRVPRPPERTLSEVEGGAEEPALSGVEWDLRFGISAGIGEPALRTTVNALAPRQPAIARIHATSLLSANESEHLIVTIARSWPKL